MWDSRLLLITSNRNGERVMPREVDASMWHKGEEDGELMICGKCQQQGGKGEGRTQSAFWISAFPSSVNRSSRVCVLAPCLCLNFAGSLLMRTVFFLSALIRVSESASPSTDPFPVFLLLSHVPHMLCSHTVLTSYPSSPVFQSFLGAYPMGAFARSLL